MGVCRTCVKRPLAGTSPRTSTCCRTWEGCSVRVTPPEGDPFDMHLFGSILERDGVFKFVSYTNDY